MDAVNFEDLSHHFTEKLSALCEALAIQSCVENTEDEDEKAEVHQPMQSLWQEVEELSAILSLIRSKCADQRNALAGVEDVKQKMLTLVNGINYTCNNIPSHLPVLTASAEPSPPASAPPQSTAAPRPPSTADSQRPNQGETVRANTVAQTSSKNNTKQQQLPPCPLIEYLTVDEFTEVPKYMKGRLTYRQVNTVIDELNKAFTAKYKLLRQKKSTMNDILRKRFETLKMQESKDTRGVYFLVENDIKEWSILKMSKETRTLFTVLRHCGRLSEIRGGGLVRYAMIEMY